MAERFCLREARAMSTRLLCCRGAGMCRGYLLPRLMMATGSARTARHRPCRARGCGREGPGGTPLSTARWAVRSNAGHARNAGQWPSAAGRCPKWAAPRPVTTRLWFTRDRAARSAARIDCPRPQGTSCACEPHLAKADGGAGLLLHAVEDLKHLIETDAKAYMYFVQMFDQVSARREGHQQRTPEERRP